MLCAARKPERHMSVATFSLCVSQEYPGSKPSTAKLLHFQEDLICLGVHAHMLVALVCTGCMACLYKRVPCLTFSLELTRQSTSARESNRCAHRSVVRKLWSGARVTRDVPFHP